jgi:hypothetical protein
MDIYYTTAQNIFNLEQILKLQSENLKTVLNAATQKEQGFLTVQHTLEKLQTLSEALPQVIAKGSTNSLEGYALAMPPAFGHVIPELSAMYRLFSQISYKHSALDTYRYYVMGQICVAETSRGFGVFDGLYMHHKSVFESQFDLIVTEVSLKNSRSLRAHQRVGFETIHEYYDASNDDTWAVVLWDWS